MRGKTPVLENTDMLPGLSARAHLRHFPPQKKKGGKIPHFPFFFVRQNGVTSKQYYKQRATMKKNKSEQSTKREKEKVAKL